MSSFFKKVKSKINMMIYKHKFEDEVFITKGFDKINQASKKSNIQKSFGKKNPNKKFLLLKEVPVEVFSQISFMF